MYPHVVPEPLPEAGPADGQRSRTLSETSPQFGVNDPVISPSATRGSHNTTVGSPARSGGKHPRRTPGAELVKKSSSFHRIGGQEEHPGQKHPGLLHAFEGLDVSHKAADSFAAAAARPSYFSMWDSSAPLPSDLYTQDDQEVPTRSAATDIPAARDSFSDTFSASSSYSPSESYSPWGMPSTSQATTAPAAADFVESAFQRHVNSVQPPTGTSTSTYAGAYQYQGSGQASSYGTYRENAGDTYGNAQASYNPYGETHHYTQAGQTHSQNRPVPANIAHVPHHRNVTTTMPGARSPSRGMEQRGNYGQAYGHYDAYQAQGQYYPPAQRQQEHTYQPPHVVQRQQQQQQQAKQQAQQQLQLQQQRAQAQMLRRSQEEQRPKPAVPQSQEQLKASQGSTGEPEIAEEPVDSPNSKLKLKQFYRQFKQVEKEDGYDAAMAFAQANLQELAERVHYRVYLEMADLAKRENQIDNARQYYGMVNQLQPRASQGWLEFAKMEEECGNLHILEEGLRNCPVNEPLMVKCLKYYERLNAIGEARSLLARLKDVPLDRSWRTIMEGGLLEARQGNTAVARKVLNFLVRNVPWFGPIYQEACRFEEKCEEYENALKFVEKGLAENPRYGPLWFSALRLKEKLMNSATTLLPVRGESPGLLERPGHSKTSSTGSASSVEKENGPFDTNLPPVETRAPTSEELSAIEETIEKAMSHISRELIWKLYYEAAQIYERAGSLTEARAYYVHSVSHCPNNLLWKVWLGGARTELNFGNVSIARKLLKRALKEVPLKMKAMVLLEYSRLEEFDANLDKARAILDKAKKYTKHEWKVFLESVLLEIRANNKQAAIKEAASALKVHTGTGRLWAVMIQLMEDKGCEEQTRFFRQALNEVPKSGEVWCEGARVAIRKKDYAAARKYIGFAIQFTPQYGDSFIEYLRLELLEHGHNADIRAVEQACVNADPNYGTLWLHCKLHPLDSTRQVLRVALRKLSSRNGADGLSVNDIYNGIHERSEEERRKAIFL